jgi:iodothyronine deiodinase-like protein
MPKQDQLISHNKDEYRFEHFSIKVMAGDMRFSRDALRPGQQLPDLPIKMSDGSSASLYQLADGKPLLLVTGSITCPMTVSSIDELNELQEQLADKINVALVYVREAHPGENFPQPHSLVEKTDNANQFKGDYDIRFPSIVDDLDGQLHQLLDVLPNSAHLMASDGEIITQSLWMGDDGWLEDVRALVTSGGASQDPSSDQPGSQKPFSNKQVSQRMLLPFLKGAGYMHDTLNKAGSQAYRELVRGAPPVSLLSRTAACFSFLPREKRGLAAAFSLVGLAGLIIGLVMVM